MTDKQEQTFAILAALLVLFTAMLNPIISALLALFLLTLYLYFHVRRGKRK